MEFFFIFKLKIELGYDQDDGRFAFDVCTVTYSNDNHNYKMVIRIGKFIFLNFFHSIIIINKNDNYLRGMLYPF